MSELITLPKRGLDVRLNVGAMTDPATANLSEPAFCLWQALTLTALDKGTDGYIATRFLRPTERTPGLPWIDPDNLDDAMMELADAGLLEVVSGGVRVPWDWQTTIAQRDAKRETNRLRQREHREREKAERAEDKRLIAEAKANGYLP